MLANQFSDVFVSYRRKDVEIAKKIVERLQQEGKEVWVDWDDIPPGSEVFTDDINRGLQGADTFICILSPDYLESTYCVELELERAVALHKRIIPIVYRKFEGMPIPPGIGSINWIYFTPHAGQTNTFDEAIPRVMEALNADLDHIRAHKRFLLRAIDWEAQKKRDSFLLRGDEIDQAEQWLTAAHGKDPLPTDLHKEYISKSREEERQRQRMLLAGVSVALVVSLILGILSLVLLNSTRIAEEQAVANLNIAEENEARAIVAESTAVSAEATAIKRAKDADIRLLANSLDDIARRDPFLAYRLGIGLLEVDDLPLPSKGLIIDLFLSTGAVKTYNYPVNSILASPNNSSIYIASDTDIIRIDAQTGEVANIYTNHEAWISAFDVSPDDTIFASIDVTGQFKVWDTLAGEIILDQDLSESVGYVSELDFIDVSGEKGIFFTDDLNNIHFIDLNTEEHTIEFTSDEDFVDTPTLILSPSATYMLAFVDGTTTLANLDTEEQVFLDYLFDSTSNKFKFNPVETLMVGGISEFGEVIILNLETLEVQAIIQDITSFEVSFDNNTIIGVDSFGNVVYYDFEGTLTSSVSDFEAYEVLLSSDGQTLMTLTYDGQILISHNNGASESRLRYSPIVTYVEFLTDTTFFTSSDNQQIIWDTEVDEALYTLPLNDIHLQLLPNTGAAITVNENNELILIDFASGEQLRIMGTISGTLSSLYVSPDEKYAVTVSSNANTISEDVTVWDIETNEVVMELSDNFTSDLYDVDFSADNNDMLTVTYNNDIAVWSLPEFEVVDNFNTVEREILAIRLSPTGDVAYISTLGNTILALDLLNNGEIIGEFVGHRDRIYALDISSDGKTLVSGSDDNTIIVWDVAQQTVVKRFDEHLHDVTHVRFFADGTSVLSGSRDNQIIQWDLASGEAVRIFDTHTNDILGLEVADDGLVAMSTSWDYTAKYWNLDLTNENLIQWANDHLILQDLSCDERIFYNLPNQCE